AAGELHRTALATKYLGIADRLIGGEQSARFEVAETPFEHFLGFRGPIIGIVKAVDDHDQPYAVLHGGADHAVPALLGISGLEAVGALEGVQQWIAVLLPDLVPGEFLLAEQ